MNPLSMSFGPPAEIFWYLNGRRKHRLAKKMRDKVTRNRISASFSYAVMFKVGITASKARAIKCECRRLKIRKKTKTMLFEHLLVNKRLNYKAIKLRIRKPATDRTSTHLRSVLIHPRELAEYHANYEIVEVILP